VEKARDAKAAYKKLLSYLGKYKLPLLVGVVLTFLSTALSILGPRQIGDSTTILFNGFQSKLAGGPGIDFSAAGELWHYVRNSILLYSSSMLLWILQGLIFAKVATSVSYDLRLQLIRKIDRLPVAYFNRVSHGDVLSRITNDVDTLNQTLNQGLGEIVHSGTLLVGILIMMFATQWTMALAAIAIVPVMLLSVMLIVKFSQKHFKAQQDYLGSTNGTIEEAYAGQMVVRAYGAEEKTIAEFDEQNNKLRDAAWKAQFLSGLMHPIASVVGNLNYVIVCILGAKLALGGTLGVGAITEFIMYIRQFNQPLMQLSQLMSTFQQTGAAAERVFEFLAEPEMTEPADPGDFPDCAALEGSVRFEHVRFGYEDSDEIVIKDFSADVKAGQKVAIVGPTGAGKTTLVKLLMRFHELTGGAIYIDGRNIADYPRSAVRDCLGMVLQDTWLTKATIEDNIRYGKLDATHEEVKAAAKTAQAHAFIRALPDGYRMEINEEANNISQGQKQLLTIARAVLANPRVLILDEATSSVDTRTEILIQKAMDNLMKGRTSFIIAHRLSTIRNADLILCLNHGDIVEQGTHDELLAAGGFYANLYNSQFERAA
jgi:ATP-binding cassette subfamily B protein